MLTVRTSREADGRWIAEVLDLSGVIAYGADREEVIGRVQVLALRVLTERAEAKDTDGLPALFKIEDDERLTKARSPGRCGECGRRLCRPWTRRRFFDRALIISSTIWLALAFTALLVSVPWDIGYMSYSDLSVGIGSGTSYIQRPEGRSPIHSTYGWKVYDRDLPMQWWQWEVSWHRLVTPIWFWVVLAAALVGLGIWRERRNSRPGLCRKCGYDLAGLKSGQRCPECSHPSATPRATER